MYVYTYTHVYIYIYIVLCLYVYLFIRILGLMIMHILVYYSVLWCIMSAALGLIVTISKAPKGNEIGATGSRNPRAY